MEDKTKYTYAKSPPKAVDKVIGLDLSYQYLKSLSPTVLLLITIKELFLNNNELSSIPKDMHKLKNLERLNLAHNKIKYLCPSIGKMVSLKELYLNDNLITTLPMEIGGLFTLEILNVSNNPLVSPFNSLSKDRMIIHYCRENNTQYKPPADRAWVDCIYKNTQVLPDPVISVGSLNILCNYYASKCTYAPSWVINPDHRRENIIHSIASYDVDILGLQEIEMISFTEYYKDKLSLKCEYDSVFFARKQSPLIQDKRSVNGCATFWKKDKFRFVEKLLIDFSTLIQSDLRFANNVDILNRNARKFNIATIVILETNDNIPIMIVNTHLYWSPDYPDVKLLQAILLIEEIEKCQKKYPNIPIIVLGDFNSLPGSEVYNLFVESTTHGRDFGLYNYEPYHHGFQHEIKFNDAYKNQDLSFTNFTPTFCETIDYIFCTNHFTLTGVLSPIEEEYLERCVGLPNIHFPSDHIFIGAKMILKPNEMYK